MGGLAMSEYFIPHTPQEAFNAAHCYGKAAYESPQIAHRRLAQQAKKRKRNKNARAGSNAQRPYRCKVCGLWHIGQETR